jgi:hypothetical protein
VVRGGGVEAASAYYRNLIYVNFLCFSFLGYFADLPLYVFSTVHDLKHFCVLPYYYTVYMSILLSSYVTVYGTYVTLFAVNPQLGLHYYTENISVFLTAVLSEENPRRSGRDSNLGPTITPCGRRTR